MIPPLKESDQTSDKAKTKKDKTKLLAELHPKEFSSKLKPTKIQNVKALV